MARLESIKFSLEITGADNLEDVKKKLRRIRLLSNELEAQLDSISRVNIELKPKA